MEEKIDLVLNNDYYAVTANDIVKGRQKMTLRESQLLFVAISQIMPEDDELKTYTTTVPELAEFMDIPASNLYKDLKGICKSLMKRVIEIKVDSNSGKGKTTWELL